MGQEQFRYHHSRNYCQRKRLTTNTLNHRGVCCERAKKIRIGDTNSHSSTTSGKVAPILPILVVVCWRKVPSKLARDAIRFHLKMPILSRRQKCLQTDQGGSGEMSALNILQQIITGIKNGLIVSAILGLVLLTSDFVAETLLNVDIFTGI